MKGYLGKIQQTCWPRAVPKSFRYIFIYLESKRLARYNIALRNSQEMHVSFQEGLPFLKGFVDNARMNGAKEYNKVFIPDHTDTSSVNLTPYTTKQASSAF